MTRMGMDIVAFSWATQKEPFPIRDDYVNGVTVEDSKAIGQRKAYDEHKNSENQLWEQTEKYRLDLFHK